VKQRYGDLPVYVTENGAAFFDPPTVEGDQLEDPLRVAYLREHLRAIRAALSREWTCAVISCGRCWITSNGRSLFEALRDRARGLRDPAAHAQGERPLLFRVIASHGEALNP